MYDLAQLECELAGTLFAGKLHFSRVTSFTNKRRGPPRAAARRTARSISPTSNVRPRARRSRWISAAGEGLYVSVLLRPQIPATYLPFCR